MMRPEVVMTLKRRLHVGITAGSALLALTMLYNAPVQVAPAALSGRVTSAAEGAMEGVLVNAKREGSNITITVVSNASGVYTFPQDRLQPGRYALSIRAAGYVLPAREKIVEVTGRTPAAANLQLEPAS